MGPAVLTNWPEMIFTPGVQPDWAEMIFTPGIQADRARDDFHARLVTRPGVQADRARDELGRSTREGMTIEVPNITNAIEVSKFYQGPEMKSIGV
jgi:hypothetical protein